MSNVIQGSLVADLGLETGLPTQVLDPFFSTWTPFQFLSWKAEVHRTKLSFLDPLMFLQCVCVCVCVCVYVCVQLLSRVQLFATPWTVTHQAPLSIGFPRQEYGMCCHFLLQGIFSTQPRDQTHISWVSCFGRWFLHH